MASTRTPLLPGLPLTSAALLAVLAVVPAGCAVPTPDTEFSAYPDLTAAMDELKAEQKRFAASTVLPRVLEFEGQGQVTVRQLSLEGYPGNTYVKCRFHYVNNTGRAVLRSLISLDVLDADGRMVASKVCVCIFPSIAPIYDGTWYADELRTLTHGVHEQPGWGWRITCKTEYFEDELVSPTGVLK